MVHSRGTVSSTLCSAPTSSCPTSPWRQPWAWTTTYTYLPSSRTTSTHPATWTDVHDSWPETTTAQRPRSKPYPSPQTTCEWTRWHTGGSWGTCCQVRREQGRLWLLPEPSHCWWDVQRRGPNEEWPWWKRQSRAWCIMGSRCRQRL